MGTACCLASWWSSGLRSARAMVHFGPARALSRVLQALACQVQGEVAYKVDTPSMRAGLSPCERMSWRASRLPPSTAPSHRCWRTMATCLPPKWGSEPCSNAWAHPHGVWDAGSAAAPHQRHVVCGGVLRWWIFVCLCACRCAGVQVCVCVHVPSCACMWVHHSVPLGGDPAACRAGVHARGADQGTRGGDEEESRRHDA